MIIFPSAGIPAASLEQPMHHSRIFYHSLTLNASATLVTVSSETGDGPKDSPLRPDTAEYWEASALPATWTFDISAAGSPSLDTIDYVAIAGHSIGSEAATVQVHTSDGTLGGSPLEEIWTEFAQSHAPSDDAPIVFNAVPRAVSKVRITLTGSAVPRLAVIAIGRSLAMQEPIRGGGHAPLALTRQTVLHQSLSRGGQFLGQGFRRNGLAGSVAFENLEPDWYRTNFDPFVMHARRYPYFFAWRPDDYPDELAYVWTATDIQPAYMGQMDWMRVGWSMQGTGNG